jgi:hypothetical protein
MTFRRSHTLTLLAVLASAVAAMPAASQSLTSSRGLGLVVDPTDARAAGLGGVTHGLPGANLSLVNPAGIAGVPVATLIASFRSDVFSAEMPTGTVDANTARFPLLHAAAPAGERWVVSLGFGSLLDQTWAVEVGDTLLVGGEPIGVRDIFESVGGAGRFRLGGAYRFGERLAVGAGLDLYTGSQRRQFRRDFAGPFDPTVETREWSYGGLGYAGGIHWEPSDAAAIGVAVSAGGRLEARPLAGDGARGTYALPLQASLAGSARVLPDLLLAASGDWAGWSSVEGDLVAGGVTRDTWSAQGGLEWTGMMLRDRPMPIRLGGRYRQLPFGWTETAEIDERALTGGLGLRLAGGAANIDVSVERGWRGGDQLGINESYWRTMLSLNVFGR